MGVRKVVISGCIFVKNIRGYERNIQSQNGRDHGITTKDYFKL